MSYKKILVACGLFLFSTSSFALMCQEENTPESYQNCISDYHRTLAQELSQIELRQKLKATRIKIVFPVTTTLQQTLRDVSEKVYYHVVNISPTHYQITFDLSPFCEGKETCVYGALYVAELDDQMPRNDYATYEKKSKKTRTKIALTKHVKGYLEKIPGGDETKGPFRTLIWNYQGIQYQLTLKGYKVKEFITLANHLIETGY